MFILNIFENETRPALKVKKSIQSHDLSGLFLSKRVSKIDLNTTNMIDKIFDLLHESEKDLNFIKYIKNQKTLALPVDLTTKL
jgi:hypothetical protein